jgi:hypothetical protein
MATATLAMDNVVNDALDKRLDRNQSQLDQLKIEQDRVYADLREARAWTDTGFSISENIRERETKILEEAIKDGKGRSRIGVKAQAAVGGVSAGAKKGVGMLESDKLFSKEGMKSVGSSMAGIGMHAAGLASGNPLLNLMAMGLKNRRKGIQEARQAKEDHINNQAESGGYDDFGGTDSYDTDDSAPAITEESAEHLELIEDHTRKIKEYLAKIYGFEEEKYEDTELAYDGGVSTGELGGPMTADFLENFDQNSASEDDDSSIARDVMLGNMMGDVMTNFAAKAAKAATSLGLVAAVGAGAYLLGTKLNEAIDSWFGEKGSLGKWLYDKIHGGDDAENISGEETKARSEFINAKKMKQDYDMGIISDSDIQSEIAKTKQELESVNDKATTYTSDGEFLRFDNEYRNAVDTYRNKINYLENIKRKDTLDNNTTAVKSPSTPSPIGDIKKNTAKSAQGSMQEKAVTKQAPQIIDASTKVSNQSSVINNNRNGASAVSISTKDQNNAAVNKGR